MFVNFLRTHKHRIAVSAPIVFLMLFNTGGTIPEGNTFELRATEPFVHEGSILSVDLHVHTKTAVNAVGGTIRFPSESLDVTSVDLADSIVDLWTEFPSFSQEDGIIHFSGGVTRESGFEGYGQIMRIGFRVKKAGVAQLVLQDAQILAHDGTGANSASGESELRITLLGEKQPSPDLNNDGIVSFADINQFYFASFRQFDPRYDMNGDGRMSWADVRILLHFMKDRS